MKPQELLEMIGEAKDEYIISALESRGVNKQVHKGISVNRVLLIAAIIALFLLMMGSTIMSFRLQHLTIRDPEEIPVKPAETNAQSSVSTEAEIHSTVPPATDMNGEEINLISLQGFMGSDSYAAFQEWQNFLDTYDTDKSILYANNHTFHPPEAYASYHCYSQELVDKIDEICEKYNLQPLGKRWHFTRGKDVFDAVGIESVFSSSEETGYLDFSGYCYKDGTFDVEGQLELTGKWSSMIEFGYRSVKKTSFDGVSMNIGDVSQYDQWNYTMKDGTTVLLALRDEVALIIVDKEDSFVTVSAGATVLRGNDMKLPKEREFLETLCEAFDFTYETSTVDAAEADTLYQAQLQREARGERDRVEYTINYDYPDTYKGVIDYLVNEIKFTGLNYALIDVDGEGTEEMLLQCVNMLSYNGDKNSFFAIYTMQDGEVCEVFSVKRSSLYLCKGGVFDQCYPNDEGHDYFRFLPEFQTMDSVFYNTKDGTWYWDEDGMRNQFTSVAISEEEAQVIISKYPRMDLEFRPVSEFPRQ